MISSNNPNKHFQRGFSLVELMVAVVVGLLGILAIMSVFLVSEGQKRTTTGGADASENALVAMVTMERDLRMAGLGLVGLSCTVVNGYNAALGGNFNFSPLAVSITRDNPAAGTDRIAIVYSASSFGNLPTALSFTTATSDDVVTPANGDGFVAGDLMLFSDPAPSVKPCTLLQASANASLSGTTWTIDHLPGGTAPFNPPIGTNIFPAGGYVTGARVTNMGPRARREYFVQNSRLMMRDQTIADAANVNPVALVESIVAIRAQYGRDTNADGYVDTFDATAPAETGQLVAVQLAVVARSGQLERAAVSPATLTLWNGGTIANGGAIALDATAQLYRYKVYQTTVPMRNVIWTNN